MYAAGHVWLCTIIPRELPGEEQCGIPSPVPKRLECCLRDNALSSFYGPICSLYHSKLLWQCWSRTGEGRLLDLLVWCTYISMGKIPPISASVFIDINCCRCLIYWRNMHALTYSIIRLSKWLSAPTTLLFKMALQSQWECVRLFIRSGRSGTTRALSSTPSTSLVRTQYLSPAWCCK